MTPWLRSLGRLCPTWCAFSALICISLHLSAARFLKLLKLLLPSAISAGMGERDGAEWRQLSFIQQTAEHTPDTAITIDACVWTDFDRHVQVDSKSALNSSAVSSHLQSGHGLSFNLVHLSSSYIITKLQYLPSQCLFEICKLSSLVPRTVAVASHYDILELPGDEKDGSCSFCLAACILFHALHPVLARIIGKISF